MGKKEYHEQLVVREMRKNFKEAEKNQPVSHPAR
jgi:hypothetical protein